MQSVIAYIGTLSVRKAFVLIMYLNMMRITLWIYYILVIRQFMRSCLVRGAQSVVATADQIFGWILIRSMLVICVRYMGFKQSGHQAESNPMPSTYEPAMWRPRHMYLTEIIQRYLLK